MLCSLAPYQLNDDVSFRGEAQIICAFEASTFVLITACFPHVFCILVENFQCNKAPVKKSCHVYEFNFINKNVMLQQKPANTFGTPFKGSMTCHVIFGL